ncbi:MAG: hypothetical protein SGJ27_25420 [Candidatus Melainabacteria bacterium]|nr:hypothetical protein [Candidatus Melainabacteria bacterium]
MSFGGNSIRFQVLEVVVRQAMAGAPWREICAAPMRVHNILEDEVEREVYRRLNLGKDALTAEQRQSLNHYIERWKNIVEKRELAPVREIEECVGAAYQRRGLESPAVVICQSPAMLYFYLMTLTGRDGLSESDNIDRAKMLLSQDQTETFRKNCDESIRLLSSKTKNAVGEQTTFTRFADFKAKIFEEMEKVLNLELKSYFQWGFQLQTNPILQRLGTIFDITAGSIRSIDDEIPGGSPDINTLLDLKVDLDVARRLIASMPSVDRSRPGQVIFTNSDSLWRSPEILAAGFVLESLQKENRFSDQLVSELAEWLALFEKAPRYTFLDNVCLVSAYPQSVVVDEQFRPSTRSGAAVTYSDDYEVFAVDGMVAPRKLVEHPESITVSDIDEQINVALRRIMIDAYGFSKYLMDSGAELIQKDECGELYAKRMPDDEMMVMVCVTNSTMEPDGTYRRYFLRVPPNIATARAGVAWTFAMSENEYKPEKES